MTITSFVLSDCFASVAKLIHGSRKLNKAHDLAYFKIKSKDNFHNINTNIKSNIRISFHTLKLVPWKQANEIFFP